MNSRMMRTWNVIYPVLMYFVVTNIVMFVVGIFWKPTTENYMLQHIIATAATFPLIYSYYPKSQERRQVHPGKLLLIVILGICAGIAVNNLIALTPLIGISETFHEMNKSFFGSTLVIEIAGSCVLAPILEEMLYRGVVYGRVKEWLGIKPAVLISAVLFGLMHFNLVQFVYAGILGILLAFIVERYGLFASILAHASANLIAILRTETSFFAFMEQTHMTVYLISTVFFLILSIGLIGVLFPEKIMKK